jgi:uncharacterized membrane protein YdjX (TVP38/TMEM64 family)
LEEEDDLFHDASSGRTASPPRTIPTIITTRPSLSTDDHFSQAAVGGAAWTPRPTPPGARRLSSRRSQHEPPPHHNNPNPKTLLTTLTTTLQSLTTQSLRLYLTLTPIQRLLLLLASAVLFALGILFLLYSHRIFAALGPLAASMRAHPLGWTPIWLATVGTAFPPLIGYSTCVTVAGFVYGFPLGWPIAASATVVGSGIAFLTSRGVAAGYVQRLVGGDRRFVALGQVLRRDGLGVLVMIRLCPLPYSLSNGFLATVGSIGVRGFVLATAGATYVFFFPLSFPSPACDVPWLWKLTRDTRPKLLVHVFIGSRLALLAESGDKMTGWDRAINYISMVVFGLLGFAVGLFIYRRTMARAAELAHDSGLEDGDALLDGVGDVEEGVLGDDLENGRMVDPDELDAAALMDDDDISLWEGSGGDGYRDSWDDEPAGNGVGTGLGMNGHGSTGINGGKR